MKPKLLFIVNVDWFFVSHRLPIAIAAINEGYEFHIACGITTKKELLESYGIVVHPFDISRSGVSLWREIRTLRQLGAIIRKIKPKIAHCITVKPVIYGNILSRCLSVQKRVSSISGLGYTFIASDLKGKVLRFIVSLLYRLSLKGSKAVIFQNTSDRDILRELRAVSREQEVLIRGSGVDLNKYSAAPEPDEGKPIVMLLARLLIDKGVNEFVEAAKIIEKDRNDIRMVLVGDVDIGNPKTISAEQLAMWVDAGVVEHWGYRSDVANTIAKSKLIVLPSYREGLPKSLIEAAACGRAVITTDVPGCRDAIENNITGLLVPVKSVKPLADAIIKLIDDEQLRHSLASEGRMLAERCFDIQSVIDEHMKLYSG